MNVLVTDPNDGTTSVVQINKLQYAKRSKLGKPSEDDDEIDPRSVVDAAAYAQDAPTLL